MSEEVLKGKNLWAELEGKKESLEESVEVGLGDVKGEVSVVFKDFDELQEVREEVEKMLPKKPTITINYQGKKKELEVPTDQEKFKEFNNHPEAKKKIKEWEEQCKPYQKEKVYRQALLFIKDKEKPPGETKEEQIKFLKDNLPYRDAVKLFHEGVNLSSVSGQLGKQD
ncbi:MAG: hypothetical protein ACOCRO_08510 [Halanaerobiales bacterium]